MKPINSLLKKCKSLSRQLSRTSSFRSRRQRSESMRNPICCYQELIGHSKNQNQMEESTTIFVGQSRKRYVISSKHLNHPLLNALVEKSRKQVQDTDSRPGQDPGFYVKCEVVLFDHLLWMLENMDPDLSSDSLEEMAELYEWEI